MHWRLLGFLVLSVTAGCGSLTDSGTDTPTVTPAPVPTPSPTPDDPRGGLAPGLHASGVTDAGFLARNHEEAVQNTSYVWRSSSSASHWFGNSSVNSSELQVVTFGNATTYHREVDEYETMIDGQLEQLEEYEEYAGGDVVYRKWTTYDGRTFRRTESSNVSVEYANLAAEYIRRYLDLETETVSRIDVGDGRYYEVVGTRSSLPRFGPLDSYRARAVVRDDGFVRSLDVRFTWVRDDERVEARYNFTYRQVGNATVTEPDWVPEAREQFDGDRPQESEDGSG